jgi:hypothetical protein
MRLDPATTLSFPVFDGGLSMWMIVVVRVESAPAGRVPRFDGGEPGPIHDGLVAKMGIIFVDSTIPIYLDKAARLHLDEGRQAFYEAGLAGRPVTVDDDQILLFPWRGTTTLDALRFALRREGLNRQPRKGEANEEARGHQTILSVWSKTTTNASDMSSPMLQNSLQDGEEWSENPL